LYNFCVLCRNYTVNAKRLFRVKGYLIWLMAGGIP
jgi:hypothetical protein